MGDTVTGGGAKTPLIAPPSPTPPPPSPPRIAFTREPSVWAASTNTSLRTRRMIIHSLNPITSIHLRYLLVSFFIGIHFFALSLRDAFPLAPQSSPSVLGSRTLNLLLLSEGGLFMRASSFARPDSSIAELHLHTYCCLAPRAKYSFVKPSPNPCLHLR